MQEAERHRDVDVEMDAVPGLIRESRASGANGDHGDQDKESDGNGGAESPFLIQREVNDAVPDLHHTRNPAI